MWEEREEREEGEGKKLTTSSFSPHLPPFKCMFLINKPSFVINLVLDSPRLSNERPVSLEPCNFSSLVMLLPMKSLYLWRKFRHEMICRGLYHLL